MSLLQFLLFSITHKCYRRRAWLISIFAVTQDSEAQKAELYPGKLIREPFGFFMIDAGGERVKIDTDVKANAPLFRLQDKLTITPEWVRSLKEPKLDTTVGCLILNLVCLVDAFDGNFPYRNGKFSPREVESDVAKTLQSIPKEGTPRDPKLYYVDQLWAFSTGVSMLETLSTIIAHSVTAAGMVGAPGRQAFKKELLKSYEGKLTDPVQMASFEKGLQDFDDDYLKKNDPSYGKFMSGKKVKGSRMAMFMTQGGESNGFVQDMSVTPIIPALEDGISLDAESFTATSNSIRYSSFARGAETINGGVVSKGLNRAADNWRITEGDCGTKLGIHLLCRGSETKDLVGRYVLIQGKPVLVETEADATTYESKGIIVRSPQYCSRPGTQTCAICAGLALSKFPTGLPIPLMEVSGGILNDSLKVMHNTGLSTATLSLASTIS